MKTKAALAGGLRKPRQPLKSVAQAATSPDPDGLFDLLTEPPSSSRAVQRFPGTIARGRPSAVARARILKARAALRRAEAALDAPYTTVASMRLDAALAALEDAREELREFDEGDPDEEGSS
jgi:hypothetical protein